MPREPGAALIGGADAFEEGSARHELVAVLIPSVGRRFIESGGLRRAERKQDVEDEAVVFVGRVEDEGGIRNAVERRFEGRRIGREGLLLRCKRFFVLRLHPFFGDDALGFRFERFAELFDHGVFIGALALGMEVGKRGNVARVFALFDEAVAVEVGKKALVSAGTRRGSGALHRLVRAAVGRGIGTRVDLVGGIDEIFVDGIHARGGRARILVIVLVFKVDDGSFERVDRRVEGDLSFVLRHRLLLFVEEVGKARDVLLPFFGCVHRRFVAFDGVFAALEEICLGILQIDGAVDEAVFDEFVCVGIAVAVGLDIEIADAHEVGNEVALDDLERLDGVCISSIFAALRERFALRDVDFRNDLRVVLLKIGGNEVAARERAERHDCRDAHCRRFFPVECHKILCSERLLFFSGAYIAPHTCLLYLIFA